MKDYDEKTNQAPNELRFAPEQEAADARHPLLHIFHDGVVCATEKRGFATPEGRSPLDLVVHASEGFIPLWDQDVTLRWRFQERSMRAFADPDAAEAHIRELFGEALLLWGDFHPVRFTEANDAWDFEFVVEKVPSCGPNGCTLARAFFPDPGQHELILFPTLFQQTRKEQVETMAHEIGHIFGLRHFFALLTETTWPAEIFGEHTHFTIMNYGPNSFMTENDRADLRSLYAMAWSRRMTDINGTPIRLTRPFSEMRRVPVPMRLAAAQIQLPPAAQPPMTDFPVQ